MVRPTEKAMTKALRVDIDMRAAGSVAERRAVLAEALSAHGAACARLAAEWMEDHRIKDGLSHDPPLTARCDSDCYAAAVQHAKEQGGQDE